MTTEKFIALLIGSGLTAAIVVIAVDGEEPVPVVEVEVKPVVVEEPEKYIALSIDTAGGPVAVEVRARVSLLDASDAALTQLGYAVPKRCGTVAERATLCPEVYPPTARCACCDGKPSTDCDDGALCRYGLGGDGKVCDPDAPGCVAWPCWVYAGDAPERVAVQ